MSYAQLVTEVQALPVHEQFALIETLIQRLRFALPEIMPTPTEIKPIEQTSWDKLIAFCQSAPTGQLQDASVHHDRYLYGNNEA